MRRTLPLFLALALLVGLVGCGGDSDPTDADRSTTSEGTTSSEGTTTSEGTATSEGTTTTVHGGEGTLVNVYFVRGEDLATGGATVTGEAVGRGAIEALLDGPQHSNEIAGLVTMIPEGTELLDLDVADGTATIDLTEEFTSGGGSLSMTLRTGQVVFTLTQFPTVDRVEFLIEGEEVDGLGGEGLPTAYEGREAFADVTPLILIESPTPYEPVTSPLTISGMSNTFEAALSYSVRTTEGALLAEGNAMATSGSGTWGTFEVEVQVPSYEGDVVITFWEESMQDGGDRLNVYEVPVSLS